MPAAKHDWNALKREFFRSKALTVSEFLRTKFGQDVDVDAGVFRNTNGWTTEKKEFMEDAHALAMENAKKKVATLYEPSAEELSEMHRATIQLYRAGLAREAERCYDPTTKKAIDTPDHKFLESAWKVTKTEKREPTEVSESNVTTVTPEQRESIDNVLKNL